MSEQLVRKVAIAALKGERGEDGWLKIDAPKATDKEISLAILAASEQGLVEADDVSSHDSDYPSVAGAGNSRSRGLFGPESRAFARFFLARRHGSRLWSGLQRSARIAVLPGRQILLFILSLTP